MLATNSLQNRYFIPNFPIIKQHNTKHERPRGKNPKPNQPKDQRRKRLQNDENISKEPVFRKSRKRYGIRRERQRREMVDKKKPTGERLFLGHILVRFSLSAFDPFVVGAYNGSAEWSLPSSGWVGQLLGWLCYAGLFFSVVCLDFC